MTQNIPIQLKGLKPKKPYVRGQPASAELYSALEAILAPQEARLQYTLDSTDGRLDAQHITTAVALKARRPTHVIPNECIVGLANQQCGFKYTFRGETPCGIS